MKYILYIVLLYVFLPFNLYIDLIAILIFFIAFQEDDRFILLFSFFAGLLIDLYYPVVLGINMLIYIILVQTLIYIKRYIVHSPVVVFAIFMSFYLTKIVIMHLILSAPLVIQPIIITTLVFFPIFILLNRLFYKRWIKI
jgi:rod shape-determining protein MreD